MSKRPWLTEWELTEAKRLYMDEGLSWPLVGKRLNRNHQALERRLGKECNRPLAEAHRLRWMRVISDGPRNLPSDEARKYYHKLRQLGYRKHRALAEARA